MKEDRISLAKENLRNLVLNGNVENILDSEFNQIMNYFIYGEVFESSDLIDKKFRELITISVLLANGLFSSLREHIEYALNLNISSVEINETILQCSPYIGFAKVKESMKIMKEVFEENNIDYPVESQKTTNEENRFEEGLKVQKEIFGEVIDQLHENAPKNQKHIQNYLSAMCFGDFYTRRCLDLKQREIITLSCLISLGGCESQVKSHIQGNINVGNTKEILIAVITQCLPYIGFPRTLNAFNCLNEVIPD